MAQEILRPTRREVLAGLGASMVLAGIGSAIPALAEVEVGPEVGAGTGDGSPAGTTVVWHDPNVVGNWPAEASAGDDFNVYATRAWHDQNPLPEGRARWTSFGNLDLEVRRDVVELLASAPETKFERIASDIFNAALDWETRNAVGLSPVADTIDALLGARDIEGLFGLFKSDPKLMYLTPLIRVSVLADAQNSSVNLANISVATLSMSDSAEYTQRSATGERRYRAMETMALTALGRVGLDDDVARRMVAEFFGFEGQLAQFIAPTAESYQEDWIRRTYNVYTRDELARLCAGMPLVDILDAAGLGQAQRYCVEQPAFVEGLGGVFDDRNFEGIRAYLLINLLCSVSRYADSALEDANIGFANAVNGSTGRLPQEERAYNITVSIANELVGVVYARRFFDEESLADVEDMLDTILATFGSRLEAADWLGQETRQLALHKLKTMTRRVGYPQDAYQYAWDELDLPEGASLLELYVSIRTWKRAQDFASADQPVRRDVWPMSAAEVNACYDPSDNSITFPAAILREPIYGKHQSASANYGAIGAAMGHEITHAFDTLGSQYDADGNLNNWWTPKDRAAFSERTARVRDRFASIEAWDGEHVDGDLTLGETVADLGGLACCLQIVDALDEPDYESFFLAFANVWCEVLTPEYRLYLLKNDPHAPNYLRTNVTCQQFQQFYDAFGVQEGDFMFVPEDQRLEVW